MTPPGEAEQSRALTQPRRDAEECAQYLGAEVRSLHLRSVEVSLEVENVTDDPPDVQLVPDLAHPLQAPGHPQVGLHTVRTRGQDRPEHRQATLPLVLPQQEVPLHSGVNPVS